MTKAEKHALCALAALAAGAWLLSRPPSLTADQIVANARAELGPLRTPIGV